MKNWNNRRREREKRKRILKKINNDSGRDAIKDSFSTERKTFAIIGPFLYIANIFMAC